MLESQISITVSVKPRDQVYAPGELNTASILYTPLIAVVESGSNIDRSLVVASKVYYRNEIYCPLDLSSRSGFPQTSRRGPE